MAQPEKINPLVALIESAESEAYRHEVAISTAEFYRDRLGEQHPGVLELYKIATISAIMQLPDSIAAVREKWTKEREALGFWKKIRTPHEPPESYLKDWMENERMRALMDVSQVFTERSAEL